MYGCALQEGGQRSGFEQYGYNGRDFLSFDKETLTWTAVAAAAQVAKRRLDGELVRSQSLRAYLEEECLEWLQKFLTYGASALLRKGEEGPPGPLVQTSGVGRGPIGHGRDNAPPPRCLGQGPSACGLGPTRGSQCFRVGGLQQPFKAHPLQEQKRLKLLPFHNRAGRADWVLRGGQVI